MKKLWKMEKFQQQLILINYFDKAQLLRFWKRSRYDFKLLSGKDMHESILSFLSSRTLLGEKLQAHLDNRYLSSDDDIKNGDLELWQMFRNSSSNWSAARFISRVLSHSKKKDKQIDSQQQKIAKLQEKLKTLKQYNRDYKKEKLRLGEKLKSIKKVVPQIDLKQDISEIQIQNEKIIKKQRNNISDLNYRLEARNRAYTNLQNKYRELYQKEFLNKKNIEEDNYKIPELVFDEDKCADCTEYKICFRNILLVGGLVRLSGSYRDEVEKFGGIFKYHNGKNSGDNGKLSSKIGWADLVLCPVNVNSHSACLKVKHICKKMGKQYKMLPSAGVSHLSRSLLEHSQRIDFKEVKN